MRVIHRVLKGVGTDNDISFKDEYSVSSCQLLLRLVMHLCIDSSSMLTESSLTQVEKSTGL